MTTSISLNAMRFFAYHGVLAQERKVGNDYEVTLRIYCDFSQAMESDQLEGTINYAEVYDCVAREMAQPSALLENVAGRIIKSLRSTFPQITAGKVSVAKLTPPFKCQMQSVAVEVEF